MRNYIDSDDSFESVDTTLRPPSILKREDGGYQDGHKYLTGSLALADVAEEAGGTDRLVVAVAEKRNNAGKRSCISYELTVWAIFVSLTLLAIIDRFTTNVWPRQTFSIGSGTAGSDRMEGFKPGPWSVFAYDCIARVSGRFSICCFNLLLLTRLRSLEYALSASDWIGKYVIDCTDITNANLRLHRWNAIALCILTVIHVWSIVFPCVFHGYSARVVPGTFEYPLSERTPPGFKDADPETKTMTLQVDDVWRMVEMTLLLCVLTPLSVRWLRTRWHIGLPLHRLIMVLYFVDIVRRHSHPHSWILNTPIFVLWILDHVWTHYWRRCVSPPVHRVKLGPDYMVLFFWNKRSSNTVGPDYAMRMNDSSFLEGSHLFTTFENRLGLDLNIITDDGNERTTSKNNTALPKNQKWSVGTVIRVFHQKRTPQLGKKDPHSHTKRMYAVRPPSLLDLTVWGPAKGEMSDHVKDALLLGSAPVVLVAAGSGIGYAIDALQWASSMSKLVARLPLNNNDLECSSSRRTRNRRIRLKLFFTTRSPELLAWVNQVVTSILAASDQANNGNIISAVLALTDGSRQTETHEAISSQDGGAQIDVDVEKGDDGTKGKFVAAVSTMRGRIRFESEICLGSVVFCQGGVGLKDCIARVCHQKNKRAKFFGGLGRS